MYSPVELEFRQALWNRASNYDCVHQSVHLAIWRWLLTLSAHSESFPLCHCYSCYLDQFFFCFDVPVQSLDCFGNLSLSLSLWNLKGLAYNWYSISKCSTSLMTVVYDHHGVPYQISSEIYTWFKNGLLYCTGVAYSKHNYVLFGECSDNFSRLLTTQLNCSSVGRIKAWSLLQAREHSLPVHLFHYTFVCVSRVSSYIIRFICKAPVPHCQCSSQDEIT